jgi:hypothetical protein
MIELSEDTTERLRRLFPAGQWSSVEKLLRDQCGDNLPLIKTSSVDLVERIRFAVLKLSQGDLNKLRRHIEGAQHDWRDVLMASGFAHRLDAHKEWRP